MATEAISYERMHLNLKRLGLQSMAEVVNSHLEEAAAKELSYVELVDRQASNLLFQLISQRYESGGSIILTSNRGYGEWGSMFHDPVIASAVLDRLLHRSVTVNIRGESYRLKDKRKAGILGRANPIPVPHEGEAER